MPEADAVDDAGRLALLITTNRRTDRFIPHVRNAIELTWPSRPRYLFLTDGDAAGTDILRCGHADFVPLLLEGLEKLLRGSPETTHVFHMLEDHVPLRTLDAATVDGFFRAASRHGVAAASFVTYVWPWRETDHREYDDGLVRTWRRIDTATFDDRRFAVVPKDFFRYFQLQPTLWRADYLVDILRRSMSAGITDPWGFEALRIDDRERHYVADYAWPTVHHGFLAEGAVNRRAIRFMDGDLLPDFKLRLMSEFSGSNRVAAYHAKAAGLSVRDVLARVSRRVRRML